MNDTTIRKIKVHLKESEGEFKHPYLDIKGKVTAGVGFNVDRKNDFTALGFWTRGPDGTTRRATPGEKAAAYDQMIAAREANEGHHNRKANTYKDTTNLFLPDDVMEKTLDAKVNTHVNGAREEVGKDAFERLNDSQKAAVTDIRYANGSLKGFPELTQAIQEGDARKMADESTFFTDRRAGRRDENRLLRNYEALSGLSREEAEKRLREVMERNNPSKSNDPSSEPEPPEKPGDKTARRAKARPSPETVATPAGHRAAMALTRKRRTSRLNSGNSWTRSLRPTGPWTRSWPRTRAI